jgi:hypothetical protein
MLSLALRSPQPAWARRLHITLLWGIVLLLLALATLPAHAEERGKLPAVNNFATAQFKLLTTTELGGQEVVAFGGGAVVLPDRTRAWIGTNESKDLIEIVQIGSTIYQRVGDKPWQRSENAPVGNAETLPISAQFNALQANANAILDLGSENVGDVPAAHYQVWLSGEKALAIVGEGASSLPKEVRELIGKAAFKYDFWIGTQDGFLHQQLTTVMLPASKIGGVDLPAMQIATLVTFFDINDPNISVNAPI